MTQQVASTRPLSFEGIKYEGPPAHPAAGPGANQMAIRYNANEPERLLMNRRLEQSWLHARPFSTYVAAIGNHWKPGSWAKVVDMVNHTNSMGYYCVLEELQDRCLKPYDALGTMRNEAVLRAQCGFEFIMMLDNDVQPEKDTLLRLLKREQAIIAPYVIEPGTGRPLHGPQREQYVGLQAVRWCVLSMLLIRTNLFNAWPAGTFWQDAVGADEGYHFQKFWWAGHQPMLDTEQVLPVYRAPLYPLTIEKAEDAEEQWAKRTAEMRQLPDRRPIDPTDPRVEDGVYLPFLPVECDQCHNKHGGDWWRPFHETGQPKVCPECQGKAAQAGTGAKNPQMEVVRDDSTGTIKVKPTVTDGSNSGTG